MADVGRAGRNASDRDAATDASVLATIALAEAQGLAAAQTGEDFFLDRLAHPDRGVRRRCADILAQAIRAGEISSASCEAMLSGDDAARRWGAAFVLAQAGRRTAAVVDVALGELGTADGDIRWAAASIVIAAGRESSHVLARVRDMAADAGSVRRKMALLCLAEIGHDDVAIYRRGLDDEDVFVRMAALRSLVQIGATSPDVVAAVRAVEASDPDPRVRRAAGAVAVKLEQAGCRNRLDR